MILLAICTKALPLNRVVHQQMVEFLDLLSIRAHGLDGERMRQRCPQTDDCDLVRVTIRNQGWADEAGLLSQHGHDVRAQDEQRLVHRTGLKLIGIIIEQLKCTSEWYSVSRPKTAHFLLIFATSHRAEAGQAGFVAQIVDTLRRSW
jgi:hypothetical protein